MSIHEGHRQRIKNRFRKEGLDHFEDIHVLELLLCYCVPRKDTNPLAHALLEHFGSLVQVLEASTDELEKVEGVGENISTFLTLTTAVCRYYQVKRAENISILRSVSQCGEYMLPFFYGRRNETVFLLCLDAKCKVLCCKEVGEGSINSAGVPVRRIVEMAMGSGATSVVLAHNHPSGLAIPSEEDVATTWKIARALHTVEIALADHLIVADSDFVSLADSGLYSLSEVRQEIF